MSSAPPAILTVGGSDSGGGAGIQADLKTIAVLGGHGLSVITALTAQNSLGVHAIHTVPAEFVASQLDAVLGDMGAAAAKTGMLSAPGAIEVVAGKLSDYGVANLVVDPVLESSSGHRLMEKGAEKVLVRNLFPLAAIVTPNLSEASAILGRNVTKESEMREAARALFDLGAKAILLKGGHLRGKARDLFFWDGEVEEFLSVPRIYAGHTHGTGCVLSAAIATFLGRGFLLPAAVRSAKEFITRAIRSGYPLGRGQGPVNPAWNQVH